MNKIYLYILIYSFILLILLFLYQYSKKKKINYNQKKYIDNIIHTINNHNIKNCKNNNINQYYLNKNKKINNTNKNNQFFKQKFKYKRIKKSKLFYIYNRIYNNIYNSNNIYSKTYIDLKNCKINNNLLKYCIIIDNITKNNAILYRSIKNNTIIEIIAKNYAYAILNKEKYNIFSNFKQLTYTFKIFKKEAQILKFLIVKELLQIYIQILKDEQKIKKQIKKASRVKHLSLKKISKPAYIYGFYLFNKNNSKNTQVSKENIICATTTLINDLDLSIKKQIIIYNYVKFLLGR